MHTEKASKQATMYWCRLKYGPWALHMAASSEGLCYVETSLQGDPDESLKQWANKKGYKLLYNEKKLQPYQAELIEYLAGDRQSFSSPLHLQGTPFQVAVWNALRDIPYGETVAYSHIAERIGRPSAIRAVGTAIGSNPILIIVPCHRVIGKSGALTGFRAGLAMKKALLKLEDVSI